MESSPNYHTGSQCRLQSHSIFGQSRALRLRTNLILDIYPMAFSLREDIRERLGERFDIRAFHDAVLEKVVDEWGRRWKLPTQNPKPKTQNQLLLISIRGRPYARLYISNRQLRKAVARASALPLTKPAPDVLRRNWQVQPDRLRGAN